MSQPREDGGGRDDGGAPTRPPSPSSSPRVRLEVELLDADQAAPAPGPAAALDERTCLTVLVVAAEADVRRYIRECLRDRADLRVLEAGSAIDAMAVAANYPPELLVVDEPDGDILVTLPQLRAIVIVDHVPRDARAPGARLRLLARPFTAERLVEQVGQLLG